MHAPDPTAALAEVRRAVRTALAGQPSAGTNASFARLEATNSAFAPSGEAATAERAVIVACSGGPDSLALAAGAVGAGVEVHAVVVDHGLQPGSGERAGAAGEQLRGLGCASAAVVAVTVGRAGGPEAAARRARYDALRQASVERDGAPVLLGHTLDDQAETVLLGLARGSGARSLAGMARWDPPWCRPLLGVRRVTTRAACAAAGLTPWDDPHNADPRFTRARLRHEVLPALEEVLAGGVAEALARTAAQLTDDDAALTAWARERLGAVVDAHGELDATAMAPDPPAVRRRVLRAWLVAAGVRELTDPHLRAVDGLVAAWRGQGGPRLPGGLEVVRAHGKLRVRAALPSGARPEALDPPPGS